MPQDEALQVVAATAVRTVETIDGGDTVAIRMTTAVGDELCVLLPIGGMGEMLFLLAEAFGAGADGRPSRQGGPSRTSGMEGEGQAAGSTR